MRKILPVLLMTGLAFAGDEEANKRLGEATTVLNEMLKADDKGIPQDLIESAHCVVVVPGVKKGAFIVGGKYGRGFITCRNEGGVGWKSPAAVRVEGGSFGFQIGGSETDVIMIVKSQKGAEKLMQDRFTLGGEGSLAGGPVGRTSSAMTDAQMRAEMLSWSRSRGVFAGLSLEGATLREDKEANKDLYGKELTTKEVLTSKLTTPAAAKPFVAALSKYSGRGGKKS
jgi:lipid-binding SYLF domain-containing protein